MEAVLDYILDILTLLYIWGLFENLARKSYEKIKGYFTWRPMYIYDNLFIFSGSAA
jgi:hypothetical protein